MNVDPWQLDDAMWWNRLRATLNGLQFKATALLAILLISVTGAVWWLSVGQSWQLSSRLEHEQAVHYAEMISALAAPAARAKDYTELQVLADQFVTGDPLWFVYISNLSGDVVAQSDRTGSAGEGGRAMKSAHHLPVGIPMPSILPDDLGRYLSVIYPIRAGAAYLEVKDPEQSILGYIHIGVDRNRTIAEFDAAADLAIGVAVALVLCSIPVAFLLVRRVTVPLNDMSRVAERFSEGDYEARVSITRTDEIGVLARSLNHLADEVARKHVEVFALNEELEERVAERTNQLRELAMRDPLTGLYNRRYFNDCLAHRMGESSRYGIELSMMMVDLDDFKRVNDDYGHPMGDEVLLTASRIISAELRATDVAARYGGDEFIVLMPHSTGSHAVALSERIMQKFSDEMFHLLPGANVTLSAGIATLSENSHFSDEAFLHKVDQALYAAKDRGKNQVATGSK